MLRDKKSLEILQQIDYNFFKSEKAKGIPKPAAIIGNLVFEPDSQCCLIDRISCTIVSNRQDACSTRKFIFCGTGILPVHKRLIENDATYEIDRPYTGKSGTPRNWRRELIQTGQSQPNIATAASLSSSEKSSIAVCSSAGRCQLIFG